MYKQMNTAFAMYTPRQSTTNSRGNDPKAIATLEKLCSPKYAEHLISSILAREKGSQLRWKWEKQIKAPKIVSFASLPVIENQPESEVIQVVVLIHGEEVNFVRYMR